MENNFLKLLKPQNVFLSKSRIGPQEDGGYIMADLVMEKCGASFSYGVGGDIRFEADFTRRYGKPAYLFDNSMRTVEAHRIEEQQLEWKKQEEYFQSQNCFFFPHGLGTEGDNKTFNEDYSNLGKNVPVLLKIDIEGYELDYFTDNSVPPLDSSVLGLIMEVHWIQDERNREKLVKMLNTLNEMFILFHVHGNIWGGEWEYENMIIPQVLELSFINRNLVEKYEPDTQDYPIENLDFSNRGFGQQDCNMSFLNSIK